MKKKLLLPFVILSLVILMNIPSAYAQAKLQDFSSIYLELNLPDDTVVLTKSTPDEDPAWYKAGITDPGKEKKEFKTMGVQAVLYDPGTDTTVRLLQKQSKDSRKIFNLSLLNENEFDDFLNNLFQATSEDVTFQIDKYTHPEVNFFRLSIHLIKDGVSHTEVIYGTIMNGYSITFDQYVGNTAPPVDETFIKQLVSGAHITEFLDKATVEKQERIINIIFYSVVAAIVILLLVLLATHKSRKKKASEYQKKKGQAIEQVYLTIRKREEENFLGNILFTNHTKYSISVVKTFIYYDRLIKNIKNWILPIILYLLLMISMFLSDASLILYVAALVTFFVVVYFQGIQIDKAVKRQVNIYGDKINEDAVFTFYDEFFTLSGIQSITKIPYLQLVEVKEYKEYIYMYTDKNTSFSLNKNGFDQNKDEFLRFINDKIATNFK